MADNRSNSHAGAAHFHHAGHTSDEEVHLCPVPAATTVGTTHDRAGVIPTSLRGRATPGSIALPTTTMSRAVSTTPHDFPRRFSAPGAQAGRALDAAAPSVAMKLGIMSMRIKSKLDAAGATTSASPSTSHLPSALATGDESLQQQHPLPSARSHDPVPQVGFTPVAASVLQEWTRPATAPDRQGGAGRVDRKLSTESFPSRPAESSDFAPVVQPRARAGHSLLTDQTTSASASASASAATSPLHSRTPSQPRLANTPEPSGTPPLASSTPRDRATTLVRRCSSTTSVLAKRPSARRARLNSQASSFAAQFSPVDPISVPGSLAASRHNSSASIDVTGAAPAASQAASFLSLFGAGLPSPCPQPQPHLQPSTPPHPGSSRGANRFVRPTPSLPTSPAAAFLMQLNGGNSNPPSPTVGSFGELPPAALPLAGARMIPTPNSEGITNRGENGDDMDVVMSTEDVFASVWETGFLVEEGDVIDATYTVGRPLGSGATSTVHIATRTDPETGQAWRYALKVVVDRSKLPFASDNDGPSAHPVLPAPPTSRYTSSMLSKSPTTIRVVNLPIGPGVGLYPRGASTGPAPIIEAAINHELEHEIAIWQQLHHRHIVDLCDVITTPECVFVLSELITDGSLLQLVNEWDRITASEGLWDVPKLIQAPPPLADANLLSTTPIPSPLEFIAMPRRPRDCGLPEHWVRRIARQLMEAINYMHETAHILHRDLKLENALCRFRRASAYVMVLTETTPVPAARAGWRRVSSSHGTSRGGAEVPVAVAAHWIQSGAFTPVPDVAGEWEAVVPATPTPRTFRLARRVHRRILDIEVKLADFGLSETVSAACADPTWAGGSLEYCPPESFDPVPDRVLASPMQLTQFLKARDVWSWAAVVYALATGQLPFVDDFEPRLVMKIRDFASLFPKLDKPKQETRAAAAWGWGHSWHTATAPATGPQPLDAAEWAEVQARATDALVAAPSAMATAVPVVTTSEQFLGVAIQARDENDMPCDDALDAPAIKVVYLPDQLLRMLPEPSALCWMPNSRTSVSPPLDTVLRGVFAAWDRRWTPAQVLASDWMQL
ncbi:serine/threonine protein kinase [Allomyces macrogynus ATCC 38327]|uniref:Serine/threonine protein kinase n=1 Tax=Allomyces macrogynus (strain ATCC 38327) TaxID=578462 RepID=A0A0L0RYP7_ALLM3|nr:serine/threonine protein kinase [Allomyces macrogynus ATCC 38327]|eukprot:KNE55209.1 serine/threonine protein kinase [Allomyces macrogynus ATCC 38327]